MATLLEFSDLSKRYGSAKVLDTVSLTLQPGRIHALMGENGAGKSTLIKLIAGVVPADRMTLRKNGDLVALQSAAEADAAGFRFIHQELNIVPQLSVAENILLGRHVPARLGLFVNWRDMTRRARDALDRLGVTHIDPRVHAGSLGTGDRMLIKLASSLVADEGEPPCLYVLDEPTAALKEAEVENLFSVLRSLRQNGASILYVSHRISEIMEICDDVTVLRNGRHISSHPLHETSKAQMVRDMTGKDIADAVPARASQIGTTEIARLEGVSTAALDGLDFHLAEGEVLGIAGLAGAGQTELLRLFLGLEKPRAGTAHLGDAPLPKTPHAAWRRGVVYVPHERRSEGLMMAMGARPNALLPHLSGLRARMGMERSRTQDLARRVNLKAASVEQSVWTLSGGNQQKVVFARAMANRPRLLLLDEPTRGVDIGARQEIYGIIRDLVAQGCSCILASSDLPELVGLSDRVLLLSDGRQSALIESASLTPEALLNLMYHHRESRSA